jgi:hypothetical protein
MATVALQQVSSPYARENAKRTLEKPVALKFLREHLDSVLFSRLEATCRDGSVYVWGSKAERSHQTHKMLSRDALVLFRRRSNVYKVGIVIEKTENKALADSLWGQDRDGETWSTVYFFARVVDKVVPGARMNQWLGRSPRDHWQGLVVLKMKDSTKVDEFFRKQLEGL